MHSYVHICVHRERCNLPYEVIVNCSTAKLLLYPTVLPVANADVGCPTHTSTQHRHAHTHAQTGRQTLTHTQADDTYSHTRTKTNNERF